MPADQTMTLLDRLRECDPLDAEQLDELSKLPEANAADPRVLGKVIFQRGWLTRFQISQVANGRGKELSIGPYILLDRLGEGAMGQVFRARHRHMQRVVALKLIRKEKLGNEGAVKRSKLQAAKSSNEASAASNDNPPAAIGTQKTLLLIAGGVGLVCGLMLTLTLVLALRLAAARMFAISPPPVTEKPPAVPVPKSPETAAPLAQPAEQPLPTEAATAAAPTSTPTPSPAPKLPEPGPGVPTADASAASKDVPSAPSIPATVPPPAKPEMGPVKVPAASPRRTAEFISDQKLPPVSEAAGPILAASRIVYQEAGRVGLQVAISPDGRYGWFRGASAGNGVFVDLTTLLVHRLEDSAAPGIVTFSPDSRFAIGVCHDNKLRMWKLPAGTMDRSFQPVVDFRSILTLVTSPDGSLVAAGCGPAAFGDPGKIDCGIRVWKVSDGKEVTFWNWGESAANRVAFNRDQSRLFGLTNSSNSTLQAYDLVKKQPLPDLPAPHLLRRLGLAGGNVLRLSPDGKSLLIPSLTGNAYICDADTGAGIRRFENRDNLVAADWCTSRYIVTGAGSDILNARTGTSRGYNTEIHIWDTGTGLEVRRLVGHTHPVSSIAASRDGRHILSGSIDGTVRLWNFNP